MKFEIKNRWNGRIVFTAELSNGMDEKENKDKLGEAVKMACQSGANLEGANLRGANLRGADLEGADLRGAEYGENIPLTKEPIQLMGVGYFVLIMDTHIKIGCELHSVEEWKNFDDCAILKMDNSRALKFWREWRSIIIELAEKHQK